MRFFFIVVNKHLQKLSVAGWKIARLQWGSLPHCHLMCFLQHSSGRWGCEGVNHNPRRPWFEYGHRSLLRNLSTCHLCDKSQTKIFPSQFSTSPKEPSDAWFFFFRPILIQVMLARTDLCVFLGAVFRECRTSECKQKTLAGDNCASKLLQWTKANKMTGEYKSISSNADT